MIFGKGRVRLGGGPFALGLLGCGLSALLGCSSTTPRAASGPSARLYSHLQPGARWVYEVDFFGKKETRTVTLQGKENGFFTDDAGGKFRYDGHGLRDERRYLLKEPLAPGAKWQSVTALGETEEYEILAPSTTCKGVTKAMLPMDDCVFVRSTFRGAGSLQLQNDMAFAREVGLVHMLTVLRRADGVSVRQVELTLTEFHP